MYDKLTDPNMENWDEMDYKKNHKLINSQDKKKEKEKEEEFEMPF